MRNKPFLPKAAQENKKSKLKLVDAIKVVSFKKKLFEFKVSTMEEKKGTSNQEISFSNPNKSEMYLFVEKISWNSPKPLMAAIIIISVSDPGSQAQKIYNSKIVSPSIEGKRNINLTYSIKEGSEIKVSFECGGDATNTNYSCLYKWLDPQLGRDAGGRI